MHIHVVMLHTYACIRTENEHTNNETTLICKSSRHTYSYSIHMHFHFHFHTCIYRYACIRNEVTENERTATASQMLAQWHVVRRRGKIKNLLFSSFLKNIITLKCIEAQTHIRTHSHIHNKHT